MVLMTFINPRTEPSPLAYYTEAEPRLLELHARIVARAVSTEDARLELAQLVGRSRLASDWQRAADAGAPRPGNRDRALWEMERFEEFAPRGGLLQRLYDGPVGTRFEEVARALGIEGV